MIGRFKSCWHERSIRSRETRGTQRTLASDAPSTVTSIFPLARLRYLSIDTAVLRFAAWDVVGNASERLSLQAHKLRYRRFICAD